MSKRLVVLFFPTPRAGNLNPNPVTLLRCNPSNPDELIKKCAGAQHHPDLTHQQGKGIVLIGRENERQIMTQDSRHESAVPWEGTQKSGDFPSFLRQHSSKFFQSAAATA